MCVYLYIYIHVCMGALPGQPALRLCPRRPGAYIDMYMYVEIYIYIYICVCIYIYIYMCVWELCLDNLLSASVLADPVPI